MSAKETPTPKRLKPELSSENYENRDSIQENAVFISPSKINLGIGALRSVIAMGKSAANTISPLKKHKTEEDTPHFITSSPMRPQNRPTTTSLTSPTKRNLAKQFDRSNTVGLESKKEDTKLQLERRNTVPLPGKATQTLSTLYNTLFSPRHVLNSFFGAPEETSSEDIETTTNSTSVTLTTEENIVKKDENEDVETTTTTTTITTTTTTTTTTISHHPHHSLPPVIDDEVEDEDEIEELDEYDPLMFIAKLPDVPPESHRLRPVKLPKKSHQEPKYTLVLDLDETLVHCSTEQLVAHDLKFPVWFNETEYLVFVKKRPNLHEFLERVSKIFEVVVFTASQEVYASKLLNLLDPEKKWIRHRLYRDACVNVCDNYLKDLQILGRELSKVIIIDNSPQAFAFQLDNGIPIETWIEDHRDRELLTLLPFLEDLHRSNVDDVRPAIRDKFKLSHKVQTMKTLLKKKGKL